MVTAKTLRVRKMEFPFDETIPRDWFGGDALMTHMVNGLNLVFPLGERFFIRSVRAYLDALEDDSPLRERVKGFMGQEVRHGIEHERFFAILEAQGYEVQRFLAWYERVAYGVIEPRCPKALSLAVTVALEHYTALFGEVALRDRRLEEAHPVVRDLLLWHAAEEIEHKSVAFDVLQRVHPSYALRVSGLFVATAVLLGFWFVAARDLLRQEQAMQREAAGAARPSRGARLRGWLRGRRAGALRDARITREIIGSMARGFLGYLRPGFHPDQNDNLHLAEEYLRQIGRA